MGWLLCEEKTRFTESSLAEMWKINTKITNMVQKVSLTQNIQIWQIEKSPEWPTAKCLLLYWCHTGTTSGGKGKLSLPNLGPNVNPVRAGMFSPLDPQSLLSLSIWYLSPIFLRSFKSLNTSLKSLLSPFCLGRTGLKQTKIFLLGVCVFLILKGKQTTFRNELKWREQTYGKVLLYSTRRSTLKGNKHITYALTHRVAMV